jgi:hypothetical protein
MTIGTWAIIISAGSLVVSAASLAVAFRALRQARQTGTLPQRSEAIQHLRDAVGYLDRDNHVSPAAKVSIGRAKDRAAVFGHEVQNKLAHALQRAEHLSGHQHSA